MFAPSEDAVQAVRDWLIASGIEGASVVQSENKGWLALDIPTWQAEELFQTEYHEHVHSTSGKVKIGSDEYVKTPELDESIAHAHVRYSLPNHIREHVDYISPGVRLSVSLKKKEVKRGQGPRHHHQPGPFKKPFHGNPHPWHMPPEAESLPPNLQDCGRNITPACLKALYHIPDAHLNDDVNALGLYESGDIYSQEDLNSFFAQYAPNVPKGTHPKLDSVDGGQAPVAPDSVYNTGESDIDMDIGYSLIYVSSTSYSRKEELMLT